MAMIGIILGGGGNLSVVKNSLENPSFRAYSSEKDKDWMNHLYIMFGYMCNQPIIRTTSTGILSSGIKVAYPQLLLWTMQLLSLELLYKQLYHGNKKIIPINIMEWFDVVALSYFIMAAGSPHAL